jgi:hypothetical protein
MPVPVIEIRGQRYMDTKTAASLFDVSKSTVTRYCREGRIPDAFLNEKSVWRIPINSIKPLTDTEIQRVLFLTLQLKNDPTLRIDFEALGISDEQLPHVYQYLLKTGYIRYPKKDILPLRLPYEVILTQKGFDLLKVNHVEKQSNIGEIIKDWAPIVISVAEAAIKMIAV